MSPIPNLGRLEKVPLRDGWSREDTEFTPWLASEENIELLGETIGLQLDVETSEAGVGPFRADILCRDTDTDQYVVIENQLEKTNHSHLGQTLTYAAGLDAVSIIWIASRFTEEHRAALDWLNRVTHEDIRFFGIEVELWRIGNSDPAPKFNIVAKPNDWSKTVKEMAGGASGELTDSKQSKLLFWTGFMDYLDEQDAPFTRQALSPRHYRNWGLGKTGTKVTLAVTKDGVVSRIAIDRKQHPQLLEKLQMQQSEVEHALGMQLEWKSRVGQKHDHIDASLEIDSGDETNFPAIYKWALDTMLAFTREFRPRIRELA